MRRSGRIGDGSERKVSSNLPVDVRSLQDEVWEEVQRRCLQRTSNRLQMRHALFSAPLPRFSSECTTASPGRDKNSGHRCLAATVAATAQEMLCSPSLTAEAPSRRRPTRFQMTTSPLSTPNVSVVLNDTSFQVHRDPTWRLSLNGFKHPEHNSRQSDQTTHSSCCVRNRVSASSSRHLRSIARGACHCSLPFILPARCHRWNAGHNQTVLCAKSCFFVFLTLALQCSRSASLQLTFWFYQRDCHRLNAGHNLLCCVRNRVSASSSRHVRSIVPGARHCSLPFGSTSRLSQMECRSYWKFPVDVISQEMIQVTRHIDVPQRKAPSRSKPTMFQMTTPPLSAPNASVARKSCSQPRFIGSEASGIYGTSFPDRFVRQSRVVRWHEASMCVVIRALTRSCIQHALLWTLRISWLCPEHDLRNCSHASVSPCRKKLVGQKLGRPACVPGASRV